MARGYREYGDTPHSTNYGERPSFRDRPPDWRHNSAYDTYDSSRGQAGRRAEYESEPGYYRPYPDYQPRSGASGQEGGSRSYERGALRSHLRCRDIMTTGAITCRRDTPIRQVARIMKEEDVGAVPVVSPDCILYGIVTDRDLVVRGLTTDKGDTELVAEDCMASDVYSAHPNDRVVEVIDEMADHKVRRIPVVDNRNRLLGIVAMADIALEANRDRELAEALERISKPHSWIDRVANFFRRW